MCVQNDDEKEAKETSEMKDEQKNTEFNCVTDFGRKRM